MLYNHDFIGDEEVDSRFIESCIDENLIGIKDCLLVGVSQSLINVTLMESCKTGNLNLLKVMIEHLQQQIDVPAHTLYFDALTNACTNGHVHILEYFLTEPLLTQVVDFHANNEDLLIRSCARGQEHIVRFLTTSSLMDRPADIFSRGGAAILQASRHNDPHTLSFLIRQAQQTAIPVSKEKWEMLLGEALCWACDVGSINIVRYLLTSPELNSLCNVDINTQEGLPLICATASKHMEVVRYLLTSKQLNSHADMAKQDWQALLNSWKLGHHDIVKFFIFELQIPLDPVVASSKIYLDSPDLQELFNIRDLKHTLDTGLEKKNNALSSRTKI